MQEHPTIRKARTEDASQIGELIFRVAHYFSSSASGEVAPWFLESITPSAIAGNINNPRFNYLVALLGQALAGVISVRDTTHVHHLFVAPEFHRKGLAAKLWERAKADALASGNKEGFSVRSSEFAVPVYERFGFRVIGTRAEKDGIAFIPMKLEFQHKHGERYVSPSDPRHLEKVSGGGNPQNAALPAAKGAVPQAASLRCIPSLNYFLVPQYLPSRSW